jgi:hypothetical protein
LKLQPYVDALLLELKPHQLDCAPESLFQFNLLRGSQLVIWLKDLNDPTEQPLRETAEWRNYTQDVYADINQVYLVFDSRKRHLCVLWCWLTENRANFFPEFRVIFCRHDYAHDQSTYLQ